MIRSIKELHGYRVRGEDGDIGKVAGFLFDDEQWTVRYLVVEAGSWLKERKLLIYPEALTVPEWTTGVFPVKLTKEQVAESPDIDADAPVSRRRQQELHDYYGWPAYWPPLSFYGYGLAPAAVPVGGAGLPLPGGDPETDTAGTDSGGDSRLRSTWEVTGYKVVARDGDIGHIEDFIVVDTNWNLRYVVVDTRNWLPGRKVLLAPQWIDRFDWHLQKAYFHTDKEDIRNAPPYNPGTPVNVEYERQLYDYYGRPIDRYGL